MAIKKPKSFKKKNRRSKKRNFTKKKSKNNLKKIKPRKFRGGGFQQEPVEVTKQIFNYGDLKTFLSLPQVSTSFREVNSSDELKARRTQLEEMQRINEEKKNREKKHVQLPRDFN
jgi:hypothetical protein